LTLGRRTEMQETTVEAPAAEPAEEELTPTERALRDAGVDVAEVRARGEARKKALEEADKPTRRELRRHKQRRQTSGKAAAGRGRKVRRRIAARSRARNRG
jgi:hypothetical protein